MEVSDNITPGNNTGISKGNLDDHAAKISELETALAAEKESHLSTMQVNEALQQKIEELEQAAKKPSKAAAMKAVKVPNTSFKVDKVDYIITVPAFSFKGVKVTAEQALQNKDMLSELVAEKIGFIKRKGA